MAQISDRQKTIKKNITGGTPAGNYGVGQQRNLGPSVGGAQAVHGPTRGDTRPLDAGPQPGAAAPVQPQPVLPWDIAAANSEAAATQKRNNTLTGLDSGWLREQQEFGLEGPWADYASNPYSRSALLQRSYDNAKRGTLNTAGNQLYAGSYINSQNSNTHNFSLGRDELQKGYDADYARYIAGKQGAEDEYRAALAEAAWNRVNAGLSAEPEPMPVSGASAPGGQKKSQPRKGQIKQNISNRKVAR